MNKSLAIAALYYRFNIDPFTGGDIVAGLYANVRIKSSRYNKDGKRIGVSNYGYDAIEGSWNKASEADKAEYTAKARKLLKAYIDSIKPMFERYCKENNIDTDRYFKLYGQRDHDHLTKMLNARKQP